MEPEFDVLVGGGSQKSRASKQRDDGFSGGLLQTQFPARAGPLLTRGVKDLDESKIDLDNFRHVELHVFRQLESGKNCLGKIMRRPYGYGRGYSYGLVHRFHFNMNDECDRIGTRGL